MNDAEYARLYWRFADKREDELQKYISRLDISDVTIQVFNRFAGVDLNKALSMNEVAKLHRNVEKWISDGLEERQYRLILQDLKARKRIKEREALSVWLLTALCMYYQSITKRSEAMCVEIAADCYKRVFQDIKAAAGRKAHPPTKSSIETLAKEVNPSLRRTMSNQLWIEAQYNRDAFLARYNSDILAGRRFDADAPENRRRCQTIEDRLLKRSNPTANEPGGHHGILDRQVAFITGYTVIQAMKDAGAQRVKFIAAVDEKTTLACKWLNGKVFKVDDLQIGVNAPPISVDRHGQPIPHPCRSFLRIIE